MNEATKIDHSKRHPSHYAYVVQDQDKGGRWTKIGAAWSTKDGDGMVLHLDCLPVDGRIVIRTNKQ